jgi:hypothetical protein
VKLPTQRTRKPVNSTAPRGGMLHDKQHGNDHILTKRGKDQSNLKKTIETELNKGAEGPATTKAKCTPKRR